MDSENTLKESYFHNDSGNLDIEKEQPSDLHSNLYQCDKTISLADQYDDNVEFEQCKPEYEEKNESSPLSKNKPTEKVSDIHEKTYVSTKCITLSNDKFEHQLKNENTQQYQSHCTIKFSISNEGLKCPNINSDNNLIESTMIRTNVLNECANANAKSKNVPLCCRTDQVIAIESYPGNNFNKELLEKDDTQDSQICKPNLKEREFLLDKENMSNSKFDKSVDSSFVEMNLGNVSVSSQNSLISTGNVGSNKNASLAQLKAYGSDGEESGNEASSNVILEYREDKNQGREYEEVTDSDSSSCSSVSKIISDTETESDECDYENFDKTVRYKPIKAKKELGLEDLPPIEELTISVSKEDCIIVGKVYQIVDQLVVVEALKGIPAYDLDTVLFLEGGQPLGKVFDVFGPVAEPYYCVRFNSGNQIKEKKIYLNQTVYSAPNTKHTNYVFLKQLMSLKGSDASWVDDVEPPEECVEYSDDEQERRVRKEKSRSGKACLSVESDADEPARKKHFAYEERMNVRNLQLSAAKRHPYSSQNKSQYFKNNLWSPTSASAGLPNKPNTYRPPEIQNPPHQMFGRPPMFNRIALPFPPPFRSSPFENPSQSNIFQNTQSSLANPNSTLPFPRQIPLGRPRYYNSGERTNFGNNNHSSPGPSTLVHGSGNSNLPGFNPNPPNWLHQFPPNSPHSMNSPPPPLRSPGGPNSSLCWNPQIRPPFPDTNNQTPRSIFPRNSIQPSFPPSRPFVSAQSTSQSSLPKNIMGIGFNPNIPPPRPYVINPFENPPNNLRVTFNSNIPPPPPLPTYRPIVIPTNTSTQSINVNLNVPPPSQNSWNK